MQCNRKAYEVTNKQTNEQTCFYFSSSFWNRDKLKEIWNYSHGFVTKSLLKAKKVQQKNIPLDDTITPVKVTKRINLNDKEKEKDKAVEVLDLEKVVGKEKEEEEEEEEEKVEEDLDCQMIKFIKNSAYFQRILFYEPIPLLQLQEDLKHHSVKVSQKTLANFLDSKGIVYSDPTSKWK